ncbi:MAG: cytochrome b N-terminal domain-containing protein [Acetobacter indonesiensis]|jgi:quinol-cytochrome oxidoreductase complex cytochrome b subunit|nr:cytochrome b N-terminal domain-containing protein [Acetobacter indonesiensis]MCI1545612.1 cytochrome b N-terminal domain-containing protein [Acetobacter indonesiensis]MCI1765224.1 cytochrome b N-terminal domain-containing protein [Acetobacter indonesiensis]
MAGTPSYQKQHPPTGSSVGVSAFVKEYMGFLLPRDLNMLWTVGAMLLAVLALMVMSGLSLALSYTPDATLAFHSVEALERRLPAGWLLRSLHMTGASFFMAALYLHVFRGLCYGSYRAPRRGLWLIGTALLVMVMVTAFAGYVLPWGQMSYWGADVAGKAVGAVPVVGPLLERVFLGGDAPGTATLHRMFVLHFTLAFSIVGAVILHVAVLHAKGSSSPSGRIGEQPDRKLPFYPYFTIKDTLGVVLMSLLFTLVMCFWPGLITESANYRPANPLHTPADIEPEWYFLPFYGMLQAVPSKFGGLVVSAGAVVILFCVPWLDKGADSLLPWAGHRWLARVALGVLVVSFIVAGLAGRHHVQGPWLLAGRIATLGYYAYFLAFLPFYARLGRRGGGA